MEVINVTPFSQTEARQLTEEIKSNFNTLGERILEAYRRRAWEALGYQNFTSYTEAEFGLSKSESYSLRVNALTTLSLLPQLGEEAYKIPSSQKELLHKLPSEKRAEGFKEAQQLAKDRGREKPTAKDLKQVIETTLGKPTKKIPANPQPLTVSQPPTITLGENSSDNLTELREKLRQKTKALEITLQALEQARKETREKAHKLERKVNTLNAVLEALDQVRREGRLLREENKQLKKLLSSLGGTY